MRVFSNPNQLLQIIIVSRLRSLDGLAQAFPYVCEIRDSNLLVTGYTHNVSVDSILTEQQITNALSTPQTAEETAMLSAFASAATGFNSLPDWATYSASEAEAAIMSQVFNGATLTQVEAQIDGLPNTVAGMKTGLKQAAEAIIGVRSMLIFVAKAVIYLRDYIIRLRR